MATRWDEGNEAFPPTSMQISNITAGTGAGNVIPVARLVQLPLRYRQQRSRIASAGRGLHCIGTASISNSNGTCRASPFLTAPGRLRDAVEAAILARCGLRPESSTGGGPSDGRFIAPLGAEVVELGPVNASIHKVDEHVDLADLEVLPELYRAIIASLLARSG